MINIQNEVYTLVYNKVSQIYPDIDMGMDITITPAKFPHITFAEQDNTNYKRTSDTGSNENDALVMYQADIFSESEDDRVSECYDLAEIVDEVMLGLGFNRVSLTPIPDLSYYRISIRYEAIVSKEIDGINYIKRSV